MQRRIIKQKIDKLIDEIVENLKKELSCCIESITLCGSYTIGKISLERPNVNMLIFTKGNISGLDRIKIGEIFYRTSDKYKNHFSIKIDSLPFRFGIPTGKDKLQFVLTPNILNLAEKNQKPAFGIPHNVLKGMKATKKIVFGSDPLADMELSYTRKELIQWTFFDVGILFRNLLSGAPLSYDVEKHLDLLTHESVELGKLALYWGVEIFMDMKDIKKNKHIELIKDNKKLTDFYQNIDKELGKCAKIILDARKNFQSYKTDKDKTYKLYEAAYIALGKVFQQVLSEMK